MRIVIAVLGLLGLGCLLAPLASLPGQEKGKTAKGATEHAADFAYPKAEKLTTAASPAGEGPGICHAKYTSADSWGKVVAWYREKLRLRQGEGLSINPGSEQGIRGSVLEDSRQPKGPGKAIGEPRPVSLVVLLKKTNDFTVNVVVSRATDEKLTHVVLTVVDNKSQ